MSEPVYLLASVEGSFDIQRTIHIAVSLLNISINIVVLYRIAANFGWLVIFALFAIILRSRHSPQFIKSKHFEPIESILASSLTLCGFTNTQSQILWISWNAALFICVIIRPLMERHRRYNVYQWDECRPLFD